MPDDAWAQAIVCITFYYNEPVSEIDRFELCLAAAITPFCRDYSADATVIYAAHDTLFRCTMPPKPGNKDQLPINYQYVRANVFQMCSMHSTTNASYVAHQ